MGEKFRAVFFAILDSLKWRLQIPVTTVSTVIFLQLQTLDDWTFDVFALSEAANGQPVKYLGYDLLNRYGIIHKFKVSCSARDPNLWLRNLPTHPLFFCRFSHKL
jgi:hypothetical protein